MLNNKKGGAYERKKENQKEDIKQVRKQKSKEKENNEESKKKESKKKLLVSICIFVAIVVLTIGVVATVIKDNKIDEENEPQPLYCNSGDFSPSKPIIYLYPQQTTKLTVKLGNPENITCSYPEYNSKWEVVASPDGTITDISTNRQYYALYWEGKNMAMPETTQGFVVKGEDTAKFLEEKLEILGLNEKEMQEFIIYWLPKMQNNEYNYIRFATIDEINSYMPLEFSTQPDTLIRVLMQFKPLEEYVEVKEQELTPTQRVGFTVVEWGGSEI